MPEPRRLVRRAIRPVGENHEAERSFWGPHPDPAVARIEEELYQVGFQFLRELYGAAFGVAAPRKLQKSFAFGAVFGKIPGWGHVAELFKRKELGPLEIRNAWGQVIDRLCNALFHQRTQEEVAAATAVRCHWLGRIRTLSEEGPQGPPPRNWDDAHARMKRQEQEAMEWTRTRALEACRNLSDSARDGLRNVLLQARQEGLGTREVQRRCFDRFADLNRDWRRTALTETASAVSNAQLAAVPEGEGWEAVWVSCRGGCEHCQGWNGKVFRVVSADYPLKNGDTMVWSGKTNIGRHGARRTRDGRMRVRGELWWPCIPVHPNCGCSFVLRRRAKRKE